MKAVYTPGKPGLQYFVPALSVWQKSANGESFGLASGLTYRRRLPILASRPEAIPLEPGEVPQVGDRGLTRDGLDTGVLEANTGAFSFTHPLRSIGLRRTFMLSGKHDETPNSELNIIARLPRVAAKEPENGKEEKVREPQVKLNQPVYYTPGNAINAFINASEAARLYIENESVRADVERQEQAKRIGPGDWFRYSKIFDYCSSLGTDVIFGSSGSYPRESCRKIESPELIAALNAEMEKAKGE